MSTKVISLLRDGYLLLTGSGSVVSLSEYEALTEKYLQEVIKYDVPVVVVDETEMQFAPSLLLQSDVVQFYDVNFPDKVKNLKVAVVSNKESLPFQQFWEHCVNAAGYNYKVFATMNDAVAFVKG